MQEAFISVSGWFIAYIGLWWVVRHRGPHHATLDIWWMCLMRNLRKEQVRSHDAFSLNYKFILKSPSSGFVCRISMERAKKTEDIINRNQKNTTFLTSCNIINNFFIIGWADTWGLSTNTKYHPWFTFTGIGPANISHQWQTLPGLWMADRVRNSEVEMRDLEGRNQKVKSRVKFISRSPKDEAGRRYRYPSFHTLCVSDNLF